LSASHASTIFGSLIGHVSLHYRPYHYAVVDRAWRRLFYESDPLHRELVEGVRTHVDRCIGDRSEVSPAASSSAPVMLSTGRPTPSRRWSRHVARGSVSAFT